MTYEHYPLNKFPVGSKVLCTKVYSKYDKIRFLYKAGEIYTIECVNGFNCICIEDKIHSGISGEWVLYAQKSLDDYM